jgi:ADP-ribose pyrophosphatase
MSSIDISIVPWQTLSSCPLLDRPPWLTVWEEDVLLPTGHRIEGYLQSTGRDYAVIFARMKDGSTPMVRQYKHGLRTISLDLPAGYLDAGEDPLVAAQRELREETGVVAETWRALGSFVVDTNRGPTAAHLFLALGGQRVGEQELDASEEIEVEYYTPQELELMALAGEIRSLATVTGIMMALRLI